MSDGLSTNGLNSNDSYGAYTESFIARSDNPSLIRRAIDRRGMTQLVGGITACLLLAVALLFHAWMRTQVTQEGYRLSRLASEHQKLLRTREELTLASARLRNPARIEKLAREQLKMGPPTNDRVVVLATKKMPMQAEPMPPDASAVARR
jgi:cell division protein FtsL